MSTYNLLTTDEAATKLAMSDRRVRALCKAGRLGQLLGSRWVISEEELREFQKKPRIPGNPRIAKKK